MNTKKIMESERQRFVKIINFRLPHKFMTIGIAVAALSIIMMFVRAFALDGENEWLRVITKQGLLVGMLIISISRDRVEDEMTITLRAQSYAVAFVIGVVYALIMPYIELGVSNVVHSGGEAFKELDNFQVLSFMLLIQLMFYHNLKRYR